MTAQRKKLIEAALPLKAVTEAYARLQTDGSIVSTGPQAE